MRIKHSIVVLLCALFGYLVHESNCSSCDDCLDCNWTPCFEHSYQSSIKLLWQTSHDLSDLLMELKCTVLSLAKEADKKLFVYLLGVSLWANNYFSRMPSALHHTCIFAELMNQTLVNKLSDDECAKENLKKAIKEYGDLVYDAIDNAVFDGMRLGGCHIKVPKVNSSAPCEIGIAPDILLESSGIPKPLIPILNKLLESNVPDHQAIAAIAFGVSTMFGRDFFEILMDNKAFLRVVQLMACPVKIDKRCCSKREKLFLHFAENLKKFISLRI